MRTKRVLRDRLSFNSGLRFHGFLHKSLEEECGCEKSDAECCCCCAELKKALNEAPTLTPTGSIEEIDQHPDSRAQARNDCVPSSSVVISSSAFDQASLPDLGKTGGQGFR